MAEYQKSTTYTRIKEYKIQLWEMYTEKVSGVTTKKYRPRLDVGEGHAAKQWAYYQYITGNLSVEGSSIKVYDGKVRAMFIVNRRSDIIIKPTDLLIFRGEIWTVDSVDDFRGHEDPKIIAQKNTDQNVANYKGLIID